MAKARSHFPSNEQNLIELIKDKLGNRFIGDDCAVLPGQMLVSLDTLVDGTHFLSDKVHMRDLGWKALSVNLSDIAAMAGKPRFALVSVTLPKKFPKSSFANLYDGLKECAECYRTTIVGGDITGGPVLTIAITIIGESNSRGVLTRSGAREGDVVVVSGDFGASRAGQAELLNKPARAKRSFDEHSCLGRHMRPVPRLKEAWALANQIGSRGALMDASDGLADSLFQIAQLSEVGMTIDLEKLPIAAETKKIAKNYGADVLDWALYGGEDYELVATLSSKSWQKWLESTKHVPFTEIGSVTKGSTVTLKHGQKEGPELDLAKAFQHISE
jgi:thiamine-monophosphate kinase